MRVAIRHALGQHSITPTLDFDQEPAFASKGPRLYPDNQNLSTPNFSGGSSSTNSFVQNELYRNNLANWEKLYEGSEEDLEETVDNQTELFDGDLPPVTIQSEWEEPSKVAKETKSVQRKPYQIHNTYIVSPIKSGFLLIDQQNAHERILYEQFMDALETDEVSTQQQLFPKTLELSPNDAELLLGLLPQINALGFDIQEFGDKTFIINGLPTLLHDKVDENEIIESLLEQCKIGLDLELNAMASIAKAMARSASLKRGQALTETEMQAIIDQLFACTLPFKSPSGKNCFITYDLDELTKRFSS